VQAIRKRVVIDGALRTNPVQAITKPRQRRSREPVVTRPEHVEAIRATLLVRGRQRDATLIALLAYAGPRPETEGVTITWPQIRQRTILLRASKRNGAERTVPLLASSSRWRSPSGSRSTFAPNNRLPTTSTRRARPPAAAAWCSPPIRAPGVTTTERTGSVRDLRGSLATLLIYEGRNISEVARMMRHSAQTCLRDHLSVFEEFDPSQRTDAEAWSARARESAVPAQYPAAPTRKVE
jgi:site-specific recombinase XerD